MNTPPSPEAMRVDKWLWTARVIVRSAAARRVSAPEAGILYDETDASVVERKRQAELRGLAGPVELGRRPTKRDRRRYDAGRHDNWSPDLSALSASRRRESATKSLEIEVA